MPEPEVVAERRGFAGVLVLNRPQALNALTLGMVRVIAAALDAFEADPEVARVVVTGAGERAFSAGGDIRWLYERGKARDFAAQSAFFREEYKLNAHIKRYSKPYVSLIDGVVMGGGVGVSLHGSHRVATENAKFAMPEVGIGFFPDVGATYALPRVPHRIGVAMAATGLRANGADMAALGLATHYLPVRSALSALLSALQEPGDTDAILARFAAPPPSSTLTTQAAFFERVFASTNAAGVVAALRADDSALAQDLLAKISAASPTSLAIALRQCELGAGLTFEEAMRIEFRIVSRICHGHDFYEGVRATLIDKDGKPRWAPAPSAAEIDAYFAPLGAEDLQLPGATL